MFSAKLLFLLAAWLFISTLYSEKTKDTYSDGLSPPTDCENCTLCQYPCHAQPPPPPSGYQPYGAPPPPPAAEVNCPPSSPVQCCQYSPPIMPYYNYPYSNYSGSTSLQHRIKPSSSTWYSAILFISIILVGSQV
ncbi:hypothetical protein ACH5RR_029474 [Cinchona calisaya]|uniref:Uncharacterized protein n=1 Tax=Cinchona calisaya TaxID=153742 RepID=A0ABD2YRV9_9GENT